MYHLKQNVGLNDFTFACRTSLELSSFCLEWFWLLQDINLTTNRPTGYRFLLVVAPKRAVHLRSPLLTVNKQVSPIYQDLCSQVSIKEISYLCFYYVYFLLF